MLAIKGNGYTNTKPHLYISFVGNLIYATNTCLDICYVVSTMSRFMDSLEEAHWHATKQIVRYLKGTLNHALHFSSIREINLYNYGDAN